jgi:uracil-DNA glycosylase
MSEKKIDAFLKQLEQGKFGEHSLIAKNINNPYQDGKNSVPYENLKKYLIKMLALKPSVLLVGEAPGYNGCRLTGIPFTSEYTIFDNKFLIGNSHDFKISDKKQKERTSTIFWNKINELKKNKTFQLPLLWNIFPYHPHEKGNTDKSNRAPLKNEIDFGFVVLNELINIFESINMIYALGNKAKNKLMDENGNSEIIVHLNKRRKASGLNILVSPDDIYIDHPSYYGYKLFKEKIEEKLH